MLNIEILELKQKNSENWPFTNSNSGDVKTISSLTYAQPTHIYILILVQPSTINLTNTESQSK